MRLNLGVICALIVFTASVAEVGASDAIPQTTGDVAVLNTTSVPKLPDSPWTDSTESKDVFNMSSKLPAFPTTSYPPTSGDRVKTLAPPLLPSPDKYTSKLADYATKYFEHDWTLAKFEKMFSTTAGYKSPFTSFVMPKPDSFSDSESSSSDGGMAAWESLLTLSTSRKSSDRKDYETEESDDAWSLLQSLNYTDSVSASLHHQMFSSKSLDPSTCVASDCCASSSFGVLCRTSSPICPTVTCNTTASGSGESACA